MIDATVIQRNRGKITIKDLYSVFIALLPIVMIYKVPFTGFGIATLLLGASAPYPLYMLISMRRNSSAFFFVAFSIYIIIRNIGAGIAPVLFFIALVHVLGVENGTLNMKIVKRIIEIISVFASLLIILQTFLHYFLGMNLRTLFDAALLDEYRGVVGYSMKGLFRPSALFLEPAHFSQYTILAFLSILLSEQRNRFKSRIALITAGILCSTSGIGISLCVGVYGYYILQKTKKRQGTSKFVYILSYFLLFACVSLLLSQLEPIQLALKRVFSDVSGYNAVSGRSLYWNATVKTLKGRQVLWGVGPSHDYSSVFLTGLNQVIYSYGYIGIGVLVLSLIQLFVANIKVNVFGKLVCIVYTALLLASDVVGFIMLSFWFSLMIGNDRAQ